MNFLMCWSFGTLVLFVVLMFMTVAATVADWSIEGKFDFGMIAYMAKPVAVMSVFAGFLLTVLFFIKQATT